MKNNSLKKLAVLSASIFPLASAAFGSSEGLIQQVKTSPKSYSKKSSKYGKSKFSKKKKYQNLDEPEVNASLSATTGYRWDVVKRAIDVDLNEDELVSASTRDKVGSLTFGLNGIVSMNRKLYFRANGNYGKVIQPSDETIEATVFEESVVQSTEINNKYYSWAFGGAAGWDFVFYEGNFRLAPELGFGYSRVKIDKADYIASAAPFAGFQLHWIFAKFWSFDLSSSYYFEGSHRENIGESSLKKGHMCGPEAIAGFSYQFNKNWNFGNS